MSKKDLSVEQQKRVLIEHLVWIDLEMTGLDPRTDLILEIATIITDMQLNVVAEGPVLVIHQDQLPAMHPYVQEMHTKSGLLEAVERSTVSLTNAYKQTLDFIKSHCAPNQACLAGNTIWQDRRFLEVGMPDILTFLNYRMVDVSTIKLLVRGWYGEKKARMEKKESHRALDDIKESIAELAWYRDQLFVR